MGAARWQGSVLFLELHVQPGAKKDQIVGPHGDRLKIKTSAPPVDGRANRQLIEFLAETFGVTESQVRLIRGETSRLKTVRIDTPTILPSQLQFPARS
ncbi:MAG: DUF167 domain-containing protein [Povalibacter sp.]|jgi:uncharacterized protein (TIGR00251 family)